MQISRDSTLLIKYDNFWQFQWLTIYWFILRLINWVSLQILRLMFDAHLVVSILIFFLQGDHRPHVKTSFETPASHINDNLELLDTIRRKREERSETRKTGERTRARKQRKHKKCVAHSISPILPLFTSRCIMLLKRYYPQYSLRS